MESPKVGPPTPTGSDGKETGTPTSGTPNAETSLVPTKEGSKQAVVDAEAGEHEHHEEKESFANKCSYILVLVGYAVGFGNIWRFPYLMQKHGGVVFLIPYFISLALLGLPTFFLELAIGQRLRKGAVKAWIEISPYLAGVGIASGFACLILGFYYNTLLAWCLYYFFAGFANEMPWSHCELAAGLKCLKCDKKNFDPIECEECNRIKPASHYWYNEVLQISSGIHEAGHFNSRMYACILLAWVITWAILVRGIKASGKIAYVTALLPYAVLLIFFIKGLCLEGMQIGYEVAFTPNFTKLLDGEIWFAAGSQIFFSLGLGFGILVSFSSLNPADNNCYRDAVSVSAINCCTSVFAACVIFPTLGYKGNEQFKACIRELTKESKNSTYNGLAKLNYSEDKRTVNLVDCKTHKQIDKTEICDLISFVTQSASGTGLIFIAYSEAIASFKAPYVWAFLFYLMVLTLGIDSGFTTVEGAIICVKDLGIFPKRAKKWMITSTVVGILAMPSFIFAFGWGEYMVTFLDEFTLNWCLLSVGFMQCVGVAWIYGLKQFSYDIQLMTGKKPNLYMMICWRFISPILTLVLFFVILAEYFTKEHALTYETYNHTATDGKRPKEKWPTLALVMGFIFLAIALGAIPMFALLNYFKIQPIKKDRAPDDFPEEELRVERKISDEAYEAETNLHKVLYWGSSTDLRHATGFKNNLSGSSTDISDPEATGGGGGETSVAAAAANKAEVKSEESSQIKLAKT